MPLNRNQDRRLRKLNELLRSPRGYSKEELVKEIGEYIKDYRKVSDKMRSGPGISKRTIDSDLAYLRDEKGAEIICMNGKYRYANSNFNAFGAELDPESLVTIKAAATLLKSIPGFELYDDLRDIIRQIEMRADNEDKEHTILVFDSKPAFDGNKYLVPLFEHITGENVITFSYHPFTADVAKEVVLHPYLLKEYNNRWFLLGLTEEARKENRFEITVLGLDRIKGKIKPQSSVEYYYHYKFNPDLYHNDIVGVSIPKDSSAQKVVLQFSKPRGFYLITNPIHHSQKIIQEDKNQVTFSFNIIPNLELQALIMSFTPDVEVIEPLDLRNMIKAKIENGRLHYL